jgi:hypothetical protein
MPGIPTVPPEKGVKNHAVIVGTLNPVEKPVWRNLRSPSAAPMPSQLISVLARISRKQGEFVADRVLDIRR